MAADSRARWALLIAGDQPGRRHTSTEQSVWSRYSYAVNAARQEVPVAKQTRKVFHSSMTKNGWVVTEGGETVSRHSNQKANEAAAIEAGRKAHKDGGLGQAVLHKANGEIREERTYGKDSERTPG